jgi:pimeloyl-ACP methyl ester carboxylesterase
VLLHGMGESSIGWRPVLDRLSAEFDVLAIDLPGFDGPRLCRTGAALTVANLAAATVTEPAEM